MKKASLIILISLITLSLLSQEVDIDKDRFKNEIGIDVTDFFQQYFSLNQNTLIGNNDPIFILNYKRYFSKGSLRFALGGRYYYEDLLPPASEDSNTYSFKSFYFNFRIGWEAHKRVNNKWQISYGSDLRLSHLTSENDMQYYSNVFASGSNDKVLVLGVCPFLGIKYKLTNRIYLSTEASFSLVYEETKTTKYYTATSPYSGAELEDEKMPIKHKIYSYYDHPLSIILTYEF